MKQEIFLNPAASGTAEAASANGTCGKYRKISKANIRFSWTLTWGLLRKKSKRYGSVLFNYSQSHAGIKFRNPGLSLHISVLLK
jgi:hypothetical protein